MFLKRWLVGDPLKSTQAAHERLSKTLALAIFSSNAISSVAYATEEILLVLILAGTAAIVWSIPVSFAILFLVVVLTISYRQIIYEYPARWRSLCRRPQQLGGTAGTDRRSVVDDRLCAHSGRQHGGRHRGPDLSRTEFVRASRSPRASRHHLHYRHESARRTGVGEVLRLPHLLWHRRPRTDGGDRKSSKPFSDKVSRCRQTTRRRSKT